MNVIAGETAVTAVVVSKFPGYGIKAVQSLIFGPDPDDAAFIPDEFPGTAFPLKRSEWPMG